jgi:hypothetical protein
LRIQLENVLHWQFVPNLLMPDVENRFPVLNSVSVCADPYVRDPNLIAVSCDAKFLFGARRLELQGSSFQRRGTRFQFAGSRLFVPGIGFRVLEYRWFLGLRRVVLRFVGIESLDFFESH